MAGKIMSTKDAPVAPGMMSEAENRSGLADREDTAMRPDGQTRGKPDHFKQRKDAAPQEGAGPPAGPAANGEPAVAASFANELERLPTTVSGSGVALVFFALHPEKRDELVRAIRSLEDAHYRAWHLEAEVNGIREAARAPSAAVCSACGAKEGEPCRGNLRIADLQRYSEGITMKFASHCPDGQKCGATTTGCMEGECQRDPRLSQPKCHSCGGWVKVEEGGICLPCHTESK
jgi:hypothetical protein